MRNLLVIFFTLLVFSKASLAQQDVYIIGGATVPSNLSIYALFTSSEPDAFSKSWNTGFHVAGGFGWRILSGFYVTSMLELHSISFNESGFLEKTVRTVSVEEENATIYSFSINGKYHFIPIEEPALLSPYLSVGIGYMMLAVPRITLSTDAFSYTLDVGNQSAFAVLGGVGIDFSLSRTLGVFIEGKYAVGFTRGDNTTYFPVQAGFRITN